MTNPNNSADGQKKYCPKCDRLREIHLFGLASHTRDGFSRHCKECNNLYQKSRSLQQKEEKAAMLRLLDYYQTGRFPSESNPVGGIN